MVSPNSDRKLIADSNDTDGLVSYFDKKWTYQEYLEELKKPIEHPDKFDPTDPRYYKKYAHNVPPPDVYYLIPDRKDAVARDDATKNDRRVYFGWNNVTSYEQAGVNALKQYIRDKGVDRMPPGFEERDWLKWIQSCFYDVNKAGEKLFKHIEWLAAVPPEPRLTNHTIRLLQSGCFYLHGRDKFYRPAFVMDGRIMAEMAKKEPDMITAEVFNEMFLFLFQYIKKVLLLPGQQEQWVTICDLGNMSMTALPRKQILAFGTLCQSNLMYFLFRSFYTHVGWGQRLFYKGVQMFIDDETKQKIVLAADGAPAGLVSLFHPSQLEERFGGSRPTPTNFWPPYMGTTFVDESEKAELHPNVMSPNEYDRIISENPELYVHPLHLKPGRDENKHFKMDEPSLTSEMVNLYTMQSENEFPQTAAQLRVASTTTGRDSVYHDAYTGLDELEEQKQMVDHLSRQMGPKLVYETAEKNGQKNRQSVNGTASGNRGQSPVNSAGTKSTSKHGGRSTLQTNGEIATQAVSPNQISLKDRAEYDVMKNLPEVKAHKRPQAPPEQSCCSCKCAIF